MKAKGDHEGTETLYRQALAGYENTFGPEHPSTLMTVKNLGNLLREKGDDGERWCCIAAHWRAGRKPWGLEHPDTLRSVTDLGTLLNLKGDCSGAVFLLRQAAGKSAACLAGVRYKLACYSASAET